MQTKGDSGMSSERWSTERKVQGALVFALVCLGVVGVLSYVSVLRLHDDIVWIEQTHQVITRLGALLGAVTDAQMGGRRYITGGDPENLERYRQSANAVRDDLQRLRGLMLDDPAQLTRLDSVEKLAIARLGDLANTIQLRESQGPAAAQRADAAPGRRLYDQTHGLIDEMNAVETSLLHQRQHRGNRATLATEIAIATGGLLAITVAVLGLVALRREFVRRAGGERELRAAKGELEVRVQERTAELASLIESSDDAIITKTLDGTLTSWNPGAQRIFGYTAEQAVGRSMQLLIPPERAEEEVAILAQVARGERVDHFETVRVRADGARIDVSSTISPLRDGSGRIVGASKIARDITERKLHERRMQAQFERLNLLQQTTRAIAERQDLHSIFEVAIRNLEEHLPIDFGCTGLYDPAGKVFEISCVGSKGGPACAELAAPEHGRISVDLNGLDRCVQGLLIYEPDVAASLAPFAARLARAGLRALVIAPLQVDSKPFGVVIVARHAAGSFTSADCEFLRQLCEQLALAAHQAQLHASLQQAYEDLRQTQQAAMQQERLRALGEMASGVAHDINNALSPPSMYVQLLLEKDRSLGTEARAQLAIILRSLEDIAGTVARLRNFSRPRDHELTLSSVNLNELLKQVAELTRARWRDVPHEQGYMIDLRMELTADLPVIMGAENEIRDGLTNLVLNAIDAMPKGGTLTLRSAARAPLSGRGNQQVSLEVSDTGIGMSEAVRNRCLEPFYTTKGERGTGLGLPMVYGMVQRHSGDLEIESEPGVGTTIRLSFSAATRMEAPSYAASTGAPGHPMRLLVVDDDRLVLLALRDTLESDGHCVTAADGGQKGIDEFHAARARGEPFELVITDLGMPNLDGRKVAAAIKSAAPTTPVILLTGWGQRLKAENDLPEHVDRVLGKPPKVTELRAALAELVHPS
jgi:PAS domain S-box-containing protein